MLTERSINKALDAFLKGRKVVVVNVYDDGSMDVERLEDILPKEGAHYLVDVPAVENPDFSQTLLTKENADHAQAVAAMVHKSEQKPEESTEQEPNTPPRRGRR